MSSLSFFSASRRALVNKKRRKKTIPRKKPLLNPTQSTPNPSLPDDLLLSCIARVSRLYYPTLSLVSKSFRSLITSPELYKTRSLLNCTESCLYVCLRFTPNNNRRWFTLYQRPIRTQPKKKKLSVNLLVPVTSPISFYINGVSTVSVLNCLSNSWQMDSNMEMPREHPFAIATAIDGKILVKEGFRFPKFVVACDPKTQNWKLRCASSCCVIDNVLYYYSQEEFIWSDEKVREGGILKGLPKCLLGLSTSSHVQLVGFGGKMAVLWDMHDRSSNGQGRVIWCAVIALERCNSEDILGTVEWSDAVLKVPGSVAFEHVLAATV